LHYITAAGSTTTAYTVSDTVHALVTHATTRNDTTRDATCDVAEPAGDAVNGEWRELGARAELLKSTSSARAARLRGAHSRRAAQERRRVAEHVQRPASVGAGVSKGAWRRRAAARCAHAERVCSGGERLRDGARARVRGARLRRKLARCNARECSHRARWRTSPALGRSDGSPPGCLVVYAHVVGAPGHFSEKDALGTWCGRERWRTRLSAFILLPRSAGRPVSSSHLVHLTNVGGLHTCARGLSALRQAHRRSGKAGRPVLIGRGRAPLVGFTGSFRGRPARSALHLGECVAPQGRTLACF